MRYGVIHYISDSYMAVVPQKIVSYQKKNMASIEVRNNCMFFLRDQAVDYRYNL